MKSITSAKSQEHQKLINNLLRSTFVLTIKEICFLWVLKRKVTLSPENIKNLTNIASRENNLAVIKSNTLTFPGSASHD